MENKIWLFSDNCSRKDMNDLQEVVNELIIKGEL